MNVSSGVAHAHIEMAAVKSSRAQPPPAGDAAADHEPLPPQFALALRKPPARAGARVAQAELVRKFEAELNALDPPPPQSQSGARRHVLTPLPSVDTAALLFGVPPLNDAALRRHCGSAVRLSTPAERLAAAHALLLRAVTLSVPTAGSLDAVSTGGLAASAERQSMSLGDAAALAGGPFGRGGIVLLPLHDPAQLADVRAQWLRGGSLWHPRWPTPRSVAEYFGADVYEYAEFQRHLTASLLPAAAAGAALAAWRLLRRQPHRVDDAAGAAFALGLAVWGSVVTRVWARRARALQPQPQPVTAPSTAAGGGGGTRGVLAAAAQLLLVTLPVLAACLAAVVAFIAACEGVRVLAATELDGDADLLAPGAGGKLAARVLLPALTAAVTGATPPGVARAGGGAVTAKRALLWAARVTGLTAARMRSAAAHSVPLRLLLGAGGGSGGGPASTAAAALDAALMRVPLWAVLPRWAAAALGQASLALYLAGTPLLTAATGRVVHWLVYTAESHPTRGDADASAAVKRAALAAATSFGPLLYIAFVQRDDALLRSRLRWVLLVTAAAQQAAQVALPAARAAAGLLAASWARQRSHRYRRRMAAVDFGGVKAVGSPAGGAVAPSPLAAAPAALTRESPRAVAVTTVIAAGAEGGRGAARTPMLQDEAPGDDNDDMEPPQPQPPPLRQRRAGRHNRIDSAGSTATPAAALTPTPTAAAAAVRAARAVAATDAGTAAVQAQLPVWDPGDDLTALLIRYGYVALFACAFPLAPLVALASNVGEAAADATKLCTT